MLTREEVVRRLARLAKIIPKTDGGNVHLEEEREALQTALAAMDERDEILTAKKRDSQMAISYYSKYQEAIVERDALAAEGRLLREAVEHLARSVGENYPPEIDLAYETAVSVLTKATPLITAEVARVKQLEIDYTHYKALHEAELGVCEQHCDVVAGLRARIAELEAEGRLLFDALRQATNHFIDIGVIDPTYYRDLVTTPLTAAEVERVKRLEAVLEAATDVLHDLCEIVDVTVVNYMSLSDAIDTYKKEHKC